MNYQLKSGTLLSKIPLIFVNVNVIVNVFIILSNPSKVCYVNSDVDDG